MHKDSASQSRIAKIILGLGMGVVIVSIAVWAINLFAIYGIVGQTCSNSTMACNQGQNSAQQKLNETARSRDFAQSGIVAGILIFSVGALVLAKAEGRLPKRN